MKKVDFKVLSNTVCKCGRKIKQNVVNRRVENNSYTPIQCFTCYRETQANKGHFIVTAREIKRNPLLRSKKRELKGIPLRVHI